jgi:hypothetical protein
MPARYTLCVRYTLCAHCTFNQVVFLGITETGPQSLYDVPRSARLQPRSNYDQLRAGPPLPVKSRKRLVAKI